MDEQQQALQALEGASLLEALKAQRERVEDELLQTDDRLLTYEVDQTFRTQQVVALEQQLSEFMVEQERTAELMAAGQQEKQLLERKRTMLQEICASFEGAFDAQQAEFFSQASDVFAHEHGLGELTLQEMVQQSESGFTIAVDGESYGFLRGEGGDTWFHPQPFPFVELLKELSNPS